MRSLRSSRRVIRRSSIDGSDEAAQRGDERAGARAELSEALSIRKLSDAVDLRELDFDQIPEGPEFTESQLRKIAPSFFTRVKRRSFETECVGTLKPTSFAACGSRAKRVRAFSFVRCQPSMIIDSRDKVFFSSGIDRLEHRRFAFDLSDHETFLQYGL